MACDCTAAGTLWYFVAVNDVWTLWYTWPERQTRDPVCGYNGWAGADRVINVQLLRLRYECATRTRLVNVLYVDHTDKKASIR